MTETGAPDLQILVDAFRATRSIARRAELAPQIRAAARVGLTPGETRTVTVGNVTAKVYAVANGGFTRVDVRRGDELLLGYGGNHVHEDEALRSFASLVQLLTR